MLNSVSSTQISQQIKFANTVPFKSRLNADTQDTAEFSIKKEEEPPKSYIARVLKKYASLFSSKNKAQNVSSEPITTANSQENNIKKTEIKEQPNEIKPSVPEIIEKQPETKANKSKPSEYFGLDLNEPKISEAERSGIIRKNNPNGFDIFKLLRIKDELGKKTIKNADAKKILPRFGITVKELENGMLSISEYKQPDLNYTFFDMDIDENKLFEKVQRIEGNANFYKSRIKSLGQLQSIGGSADFKFSQIESLGQLQSIGGDAEFNWSEIKDLGQLETIGKDADFAYSNVKDLGQLQSIGGNADFRCSQVKNLSQLKTIGRNAYFHTTEDLGQLQSIGGNADFSASNVKDLGKLQSIGGTVDFSELPIKNLGQLQLIGDSAIITNSKLKPENFKNIDVKGDIITDFKSEAYSRQLQKLRPGNFHKFYKLEG